MSEYRPTKRQRLDDLEARLAVAEAVLSSKNTVDVRCPDCGKRRSDALMRGAGFDLAETPQPPAERTWRGPVEPTPLSVPPGVVSPHVRQNLERIALWTHPEAWNLQGSPEERVRTRAMLDHIHGMVMIAMTGEDVPTPGSAP